MWIRTIKVAMFLLMFPLPVLGNGLQFSQMDEMPSNFLIGYGSLVNESSRMRSVEHSTVAIPVRISADFGYHRVWSARMPGMMTTLGLIKAEPGHANTINGVLYAVKEDDMAIWDKREYSYDRVEVPWEYINSLCWVQLPNKGTVWTYVTKPEFRGVSTLAEPVTQSYIDLVMLGFIEFSDEFAKEFIRTTGDWPKYWLNDRLVSRRPWEYTPQALKIDQLLRETLSQDVRAMTFDRRRYSSDYFLYASPQL